MDVRCDVKSTDNYVVAPKIELAINIAGYGVLCICGNKDIDSIQGFITVSRGILKGFCILVTMLLLIWLHVLWPK